jgi:hypothetical protein
MKKTSALRARRAWPGATVKTKNPGVGRGFRYRPDWIDQKFMSKATSPFTPTW